MPDIDIDFADRNDLLDKLKHRVAKLDNGKKHNTGVYFTEVPHDPATNLSTLDYDTAEQRKYFKIDCLNVSIYKDINDEKHLEVLMNKEPVWELLEAQDFVDKVFHINGHSEILKKLKPRNIKQLAAGKRWRRRGLLTMNCTWPPRKSRCRSCLGTQRG